MRDELMHVLGARYRSAGTRSARVEDLGALVRDELAPPAMPIARVRDPDDQKFIDLALDRARSAGRPRDRATAASACDAAGADWRAVLCATATAGDWTRPRNEKGRPRPPFKSRGEPTA